MANVQRPSGRLPYTGSTYTLDHVQLGPLKGRLIQSQHYPKGTIAQFRSIPYATVPRRFSPCLPLDAIPADFDDRPHRDFTTFGAACPQVDGKSDTWFGSYGGRLEDDIGIALDEFTCLNLTISVPEHALAAKDPAKLLPVMVYVHGGGLQEGVGHVDGLHANGPLAAYSAHISQPVVTVNIGYRLNWLGSLVCQDVFDEYKADPSTSPYGPFNLTIQDQRAAFSWIKKFIGGFDGDSNNITAFAESAGSISLVYHAAGSEERLFDRAILQSGPVFGNASFEQKDLEYKALLKHFGIEAPTASERLEKLRQVPLADLVKYGGQHIFPFLDDEGEQTVFPRGKPTFIGQNNLLASCSWLGDVIVGDDFFEGDTFRGLVRNASPVRFVEAVVSAFPGQSAATLLQEYDMPLTAELAAQCDSNLFWQNLMTLAGDMWLSEPIHRQAQQLAGHKLDGNSKRKIYRYSFGPSNPFPGSTQSHVTGHHFIEILFVFLTLLDRYPKHRDRWLQRQAEETAKRWILFANGKEPWEEYKIDEQHDARDAMIAICDDIRGWHSKTVAEDKKESQSDPWGPRRYAGWKAISDAYESMRTPDMDEDAWQQAVHEARMKILAGAVGS
ncbi:Para-nitrobenzyl esterase [Cyphellophora attinorum]|uniref:Para-nitrobenzyl esterase n=1 Tax=Cyphellophora attinorum TaxID=1664694 RepID=A0A0N1HNJ0_9EURO|nr:Para-nitrobenzyl esterase [Phialophora attinorum]KPI36645.1 Para-nitrobenzyl esterase [Phialophora attinorum]